MVIIILKFLIILKIVGLLIVLYIYIVLFLDKKIDLELLIFCCCKYEEIIWVLLNIYICF